MMTALINNLADLGMAFMIASLGFIIISLIIGLVEARITQSKKEKFISRMFGSED